MIVNKSYTFWNRAPHGRGLRYLMSAESRSPAAMTAPTIAHLKTNFSLFIPFTMDSLPGVPPLRPVGNTASFAGFASRPVHSIVVPSSFSLSLAPHRYNHSIASCQKNASGIRARAYNVIYIKRRFSCVIFTKTACAIGYFIV